MILKALVVVLVRRRDLTAGGGDAVLHGELANRIALVSIEIERVAALARGAVLDVEAEPERAGPNAAAHVQAA